MNNYEKKQEVKRTRLLEKAERLQTERDQLYAREREMGQYVPLGQPILVGHHSERRHRAHLSTMWKMAEKQMGLAAHADELIRRAEAIGTGGISADDPEAIDKLKAQLFLLEADQAAMKEINKLVKKVKLDEEKVEIAKELLTDDQFSRLMRRRGVFVSFPSYMLTNNGANIRRIKKRIEEITESREADNVVIEGDDFTYTEDPDDNRAIFEFTGKPEQATRELLKRGGWRWAPSRGEWVRQLNNNSRANGRWICKKLGAVLDDASEGEPCHD